MKLLALDANSIINRAFYGIKPLTTKDGVPTNAVYGFMNILLRLIDDTAPDVICAAFDLKAPTFRHKMYADYKAGRRPMPDELRAQVPIMKDLLREFGCVVIEKEGYEADDILGTLSRVCDEKGERCIIATGDRDSLQLVSDNVHVLLAVTKMGRPEITEYSPETVMEKYGVTPSEMIEIKALQGDASDNIPGVAGVGEKTAGTLIAKYHTIDYIYDNIAAIDEKDTLKNKLLAGKDSAYLSRTLGTICREVPIALPDNAAYLTLRDEAALKRRLINLEMNRLLEKLALENVKTSPDTVRSDDKREVTFIHTPNLPDDAVIHYDGTLYAKANGQYYIIDGDAKAALCSKPFCVHDVKSLYHALGAVDRLPVGFDTMLAAYLITPDQSDYNLSRYAMQYDIARPECEYADAVFALDVTEAMKNDLSAKIDGCDQRELLNNIEIPLAYTLCRMEQAGFLVDREGIEKFGAELEEKANALVLDIYDEIGYEFNLNSPKQLGKALFEDMGLPHGKKTKTGYSTSADVLDELKDEFPVVAKLLEYRAVSKLKSTYCDGMLPQIDESGRIHSTLKQTETRTGRISSAEPNLQNIPVRTPLGAKMREYFIAPEGRVLVDADYSQIELRVLAHIAHDENMINAFLSGEDIHTMTASQVFGIPVSAMTKDLRSKAKAVNFGIVYGIGAFSLSKDIHVSMNEAKRYIESYLDTYSGVREYMDNTVEQAKADGYVTTYFGRRRYLPELKSSNFNLRSFGERVAKNMPIQGTAADIIKIAMINVDTRLKNENLPARLIMQVHDELIIECDESVKDTVQRIVKDEMESAVDFTVKLTADVKSGKSWYESK